MKVSTDLNSYIGREIACSCGRKHFSSVKLIDTGVGALPRLPSHIKDLGYGKVFLVTDKTIWEAVGKRAAELLAASSVPFEKIVLDEAEPVPDERAIGRITAAYPPDADLILAVGSGTVNDLCKFASFRLGVDYMILASAPSVDGFLSVGAALMLDRVKTTLDCRGPVAVIGDAEILSAAPMRLIAAGLGDTLGKYTCLLDWKLSHMINGEYYCENVAEMVKAALAAVKKLALSGGVKRREPEAVVKLFEALLLTGIAMSFVGNSRPASGCEHHMSHYWEMTSLLEGRTPALHGAQVGAAAVVCIKLYRDLANETPDFDGVKARPFDRAGWEKTIRRYYGEAADGIIALENKARKNDPAKRNERIDAAREKWALIKEAVSTELPAAEDAARLLRSLGAPVSPAKLGLREGRLAEAILCAKEVRERYTLLQTLWDLGLSEKYAKLAEKYAAALSVDGAEEN